MRKPALRRAFALLLALCLLCPGLAAAADGGGAQSVPVYIDGLLSARAYVSGETVFLPPEAVCAAAGLSMSWSEDNGTLTLSVPGAVLTGHKGDGYFEADGRYIYAPDGWLIKGDVLYLPSDTVERLFGVEISVSAKRDRLELSTDKLTVISGGASYYELNYDAELLYWLPQIINAEAKFEPLAGQIGVGNVVMNRLRSPDFPDTIFEVIYDTAHTVQFEPISTGGIFQEPTEQATIAAYLCLEGYSTVGGSLYFVNPEFGSGWFDSSLELVETIGHHNFYK